MRSTASRPRRSSHLLVSNSRRCSHLVEGVTCVLYLSLLLLVDHAVSLCLRDDLTQKLLGRVDLRGRDAVCPHVLQRRLTPPTRRQPLLQLRLLPLPVLLLVLVHVCHLLVVLSQQRVFVLHGNLTDSLLLPALLLSLLLLSQMLLHALLDPHQLLRSDGAVLVFVRELDVTLRKQGVQLLLRFLRGGPVTVLLLELFIRHVPVPVEVCCLRDLGKACCLLVKQPRILHFEFVLSHNVVPVDVNLPRNSRVQPYPWLWLAGKLHCQLEDVMKSAASVRPS
mmetsp:Transcript_13274/g.26055  ORF Transcript_13274/g.26055 Transcript_13274/m.26055 type:complete len:280 (+) Transcript_13274:175-1014(+)